LLLFALVASFLPLFWRFRVVGQCRNVCGTDFDLEGVEILAKMMQNGKKKQIFGTVPVKRYECPSLILFKFLVLIFLVAKYDHFYIRGI